MQILLLRHGATDWNLQGRCQGATDKELNSVGLQQAKDVAAYLSDERIHAVYSSNLKRAVQTAVAISEPRHLPVVIDESLRELDHGELEGLTFSEIQAQYPRFLDKWREEPAELPIPGGERLIDVEARAWDGMNRIVRRHRTEETIAIVSHNFPILTILCRITETPLNQYRSFHLDPCEISRIGYAPEYGWRILQMNDKGLSMTPFSAKL